MDVLLRNVFVVEDEKMVKKDVLIKGNIIARIDDFISELDEPVKIMDCSNKLVLPGFVNMHTHSAMSLFRGFGDDLELYKCLVSVFGQLRQN
jgi:5-methylthioadenosine/S-adenosylhomocysteine deaminase